MNRHRHTRYRYGLSVLVVVSASLLACSGSAGDAPTATGFDSATPATGTPVAGTAPVSGGADPVGGSNPPVAGSTPANADLSVRLDQVLADWLDAHPLAASAIAQIEVPGRALLWTGATGVADRATGVAVDSETAFRVASVSKTFVAAAIFRLAEQGELGLDDAISQHLLADTSALLRERNYAADAITIRQLLQHTSGIPDFDSIDFVNAIVSDPARRWTRREQLVYGFDRNRKTGEPGETVSYSNNGYNLLGEIIERKTATGLGAGLRQLIDYERIGLTRTWLEASEPAPPDVRIAHGYDETGFDLLRINPTADGFGAGGLVSTVADLNRFIRALLEGRIVSRESLAVMQTGPQAGHGSGIFALPLGGRSCWGHEGYWGSAAYYCADTQTSLTIAINFGVMGINGSAPATLKSSVLAARLFDTANR